MISAGPGHPSCSHRGYHLTCDQYEHLLARAQRACEMCGRPIGRDGFGLFIDHDHALGWRAVREILCPRDNTLIGKIEGGIALHPPTPEALAYLARPWHRDVGITDYGCPPTCGSGSHRRANRWTPNPAKRLTAEAA